MSYRFPSKYEKAFIHSRKLIYFAKFKNKKQNYVIVSDIFYINKNIENMHIAKDGKRNFVFETQN